MAWRDVGFGKYKGKSLPQIICSDPDWFFWAMDSHLFDNNVTLLQEAEDLSYKAKHIKIPKNSESNLVVEYLVHQPTRKFSHFDIVPSSRPIHKGSSPAFRLPVIDMSIPRQIENYDKLGYKNFMTSFKFHLFGSESARLTKKRCEKFFDDSENFVYSLAK